MTLKNKLRKGIVIALASAIIGFGGGYFTGQRTQRVSHASVHNEGNYNGDYKVIRLHKPFGEDELFVSMNGSSWDNYLRNYFPAEENIENSYGKNTDFSSKRRIDVTRLSGLEK